MDSLRKVDGTTQDIFSIGLGKNKIFLRTKRGRPQVRAQGGPWKTIPAKSNTQGYTGKLYDSRGEPIARVRKGLIKKLIKPPKITFISKINDQLKDVPFW